MVPIIIILHVCVCVALILIVLLQKGKGAGMGAAFGGSSQTVFGSAGATTFLHKVTTVIAVVFMLTSLGLSFFFGRGGPSSIMEDVNPSQPPAAETGAAPAKTGGTQDKQ
ncbi:MAG: preprotein translocase subunit SecG [Desulfobacterales bacterium]|jgi:preprotein translocase subunit SecG|nr:preprotein translocase subunit SecG [Desulfobacterales bacterium]MBL7172600.1 preprotein translocase subunit SecG [Desulfobacteraceae bacterium]